MSLRIRINRALATIMLLASALAAMPPDASATHFPPGAKCYDCHTASVANMVPGTSMIKQSPFTADLISKGWSTAGTVPCVYCHRKDATSATTIDRMKPVDLHFGSSVSSKHDSNYVTNFTTSGTSLDCRDCHTSITGTTTYNTTTGDVNVHGVDASAGTLDVYTTLIRRGTSVPSASNIQATCLAASCHGAGSDVTFTGTGVAKAAHGYATVDAFGTRLVSRGALKSNFTDCSQCHSSHRSESQTGLMVLLDTGLVDAQDGTTSYTPAQYVTPAECTGCHTQDDDGTSYSQRGHGQAAIGGGLVCTSCHTDTVPHGFATGGTTGSLRFRFALGGAQTSAIRQQSPKNSAPSICLSCHTTFTLSSIHGSANFAGCNDCHEPHGEGVNTNVRMIRSQIPKVNAGGTWIYGQSATTGTWETINYPATGAANFYRADGTGVCDSAECHAGRVVNSNTLYPLSGFMATTHTGGSMAPGADCAQCHTHNAGMGAANCSSCHGDGVSKFWPQNTPGLRPNRAGAHDVHVVDIAAARSITQNSTCSYCHPGTHVGDQDLPPADVSQDGTNITTYMKTLSGANDTVATYDPATQRCSNAACHSRETTPAWYGVGTTVDVTAPTVSTIRINGTAAVQAGTATATLTAAATDAATGNSNVAAGEYFVGISGPAGTGTAMGPQDGAFDNPVENLTATVDTSSWAPGTTNVFVRARDAAGNWGTTVSQAITVSAKDTFTIARAAGATENVLRGDTNKTVEVMTFTVTSAAGTSIVLQSLQVNGTVSGTGQPYTDVAAVKIYNDTGATANQWDSTDVLLGSNFFTTGNTAIIDITDLTVNQGIPARLIIVYDFAAGGTVGDVLGAQLVAVTTAATDSNSTTLPLPAAAANIKTIIAAPSNQTFYAVPNNGTLLGGAQNTNYGSSCGTAAQTANTHYMLANTTNCATASVWTPSAVSATSTSVYNTVLNPAAATTVNGQAACNLRIQNTAASAQTVTCQLVEFVTSTGTVGNVSGSVNISVPASFALGNIAFSMAGQSVTVGAGNKFGFRIGMPATTTLRPNFGGATAANNTFVIVAMQPANDVTAPSVATVQLNGSSTPSIQTGTASATLTAACSDPTTPNNSIIAAEYFITTEGVAGQGVSMLPADGLFNSTSENVTAAVDTSAWVSNTTVYVDCKDAAGNWGPAAAGSVTATLTAKDNFTVAGAPGSTQLVAAGTTGVLMEVLNFTASGAGSVQLNGVTITGTKGATGQGTIPTDVVAVKIYRDSGSTPDQLDGTDELRGTASFNGSGVAAVTFTSAYTLAGASSQKFLVVYDISPNAGAGDVIGANLTAVSNPATDNLTTALPVASGNIKTIQTLTVVCGSCHTIPPGTGSHLAHANNNADYTECVYCHTANGVFGYTVNPQGTHNNGTADFDATNTNYTGGATGTCFVSACHSWAANTATWGTPASLGCNECHYYSATPTSGTNAAPMSPIGGSHNAHFDASTTVAACTNCHGTLPSDLTHINDTSGATDILILQGKANAVADEANITVPNWNDTANTCGNTSCHNPSNDGHVSVAWGTASASCELCHNSATAPASGSHAPHVGTGYGLTINCLSCHPDRTGQYTHMNGTKTVQIRQNGTVQVIASPAAAGGCGTNDCHRASVIGNAAPVNTTYQWGTPLASNCGICHYDMDIVSTDTAAHFEHVGSNWFSNATNINECYICHNTSTTSGGLATGAAHLNSTNTVAFTANLGYELTAIGSSGSGASVTCTNVKCHNGQTTPTWGAGSIVCGKCHGTTDNTTIFDPRPISSQHTAGKHSKHANSDADYTDCAGCHQNGASYTVSGGAAAHQNGTVNLYMNGGAGTYTDAANGVGGVNFVDGSANPDVDDGTCGSTACHSTATPSWAEAAVLTNACFACHDGGVEAAGPSPASDMTPNVVTMTDYNTIGHGRGSSTRYGLNAVNDGLGLFGANLPVGTDGANCYVCHSSASSHVPKDAVNDPYRLGANATNVNAVCLQGGTCHSGDMGVTIGHHATYGGDFVFDVKCVDCHDPHGDSNMFMVHRNVAVDDQLPPNNPITVSNNYGTPEATRLVTFTADVNGSDFASTGAYTGTGVCEACHDQTLWYGSPTNTTHQGPQPAHATTANCLTCHFHKENFKGGACNGCHGFPPEATGAVPPGENYLGGGGPHKEHVDFIATKLGLYPYDASTSALQLCGPCHGDGAGSSNHGTSGHANGTWPVTARTSVNIDDRTTTSWAAGAGYNGVSLPTTGATGAMTLANSRCINVDCHGTANESGVNVSWYLPTAEPDTETSAAYSTRASTTNYNNAPNRTKVCETCHDETPAAIRLYNAGGTLTYDSQSIGAQAKGVLGVATNYFATRSGYARGGHGDPVIETENGAVDSAPGYTITTNNPVDCTACHDASLGHLFKGANDPFRLGWTARSGAEIQNLCMDTSGCHPNTGATINYKDRHHASGAAGNSFNPGPIVVAAGKGARTDVINTTSWNRVGTTDYFESQNSTTTAWGAGTQTAIDGVILYSNPDLYIDWWGTNGGAVGFDSTPGTYPSSWSPYTPVLYGQPNTETPKATVPIEYNIIGTGSAYTVLCTTCHNPHGTDLFAVDPTNGNGKAIPDNNMLRLRDEDNTLCNACH